MSWAYWSSDLTSDLALWGDPKCSSLGSGLLGGRQNPKLLGRSFHLALKDDFWEYKYLLLRHAARIVQKKSLSLKSLLLRDNSSFLAVAIAYLENSRNVENLSLLNLESNNGKQRKACAALYLRKISWKTRFWENHDLPRMFIWKYIRGTIALCSFDMIYLSRMSETVDSSNEVHM